VKTANQSRGSAQRFIVVMCKLGWDHAVNEGKDVAPAFVGPKGRGSPLKTLGRKVVE
jgi:hypothetical protein